MNSRFKIPLVLLGLVVGSACSTGTAAEHMFGTAASSPYSRRTPLFGPASPCARGGQAGCTNCGDCATTGACVCEPACDCSAPFCSSGAMRPYGSRASGYGFPSRTDRDRWSGYRYGTSQTSPACDGVACDCASGKISPSNRRAIPGPFNSRTRFSPAPQWPAYPASRLPDNSPYFQ